jgi:hypothetical protein
MKRIAITAAVVLALTSSSAFAVDTTYVFDPIHRHRGVTDAQIDAGVQAATEACSRGHSLDYGSKPFLACMRAHGYKLVRVTHHASPSDPYFSSNVHLRPGHFIDHDTGMDCQNIGGASVCDPPNGTVHYFDPDQGLPCTRTGIVSICSNM